MGKVLIVSTVISTINAFLLPDIKRLQSDGYKVDIAANICGNDEVIYKFKEKGLQIHNIGFQRSPIKISNYKSIEKIRTLVKNNNYQKVHVHTPIAAFITRLALRKEENIEIIYTAHGFHFYNGAPLLNWLIFYPAEKVAANWTDKLIVMNEEDYYRGRNLKLRDNSRKIYKINGIGVNTEKFRLDTDLLNLRMEYGYKENDFILIYIAELNKNKNQIILINRFKQLKKQIPEIKLILVGGGPLYKYYNEEIQKQDLEKEIKLMGIRKDIAELLNISDIVVGTSKREGLPVNIIESLAAGLPIVASNIRGHRDLIINGKNGYLFNNEDEMIDSILKLYKDREKRLDISETNIKDSRKYNVDKVLLEMDEIYKDV